MYDVIKMSNPKQQNLSSNFSLGNFTEGTVMESTDQFFTEAVFTDGKKTVMPLVETLQKIKDLLDAEIAAQDQSYEDHKDAAKKRKLGEHVTSEKIKYFDPKAFWKNQLFKDLEDQISKIFGFRSVQIQPYIEKYSSSEKIFESRILNAEIYHQDRFPVEGLVTDKGFYDKSKSVVMQVYLSLGLIKALTAEEILAVLLHEFGHSIDPALIDIKYSEANILSKYLTDRKHKINKDEEKVAKGQSKFIIILSLCLLGCGIAKLFGWIRDLIIGKEKVQERELEKIRKMVEADKTKFVRQEYSEAFADNFARMYGFGAQLMSGLKKLSAEMDRKLRSRYRKERERQKMIVSIATDMINDVHKTDIHRIRALLKEYQADIDDPNISAVTKKQLKEDMEELNKVLDEYMNNFDEFQNRVNRIINEELEKADGIKTGGEKKEDKKDDEKDKVVTEEVEYFDESKAAYEKLMKAKESLSSSERAAIKEKFGDTACSFGKDKDGYYCFTHRCRSKSYKSIDEIPQDKVDFVCSTS